MNFQIPTQVRDLDANEREFIAQNLQGARNMLGKLIGKNTKVTPEALDVAYSEWLSNRDATDDPSQLITLFGIAFCQCIADKTGMNWKVVVSENGNEPAIHKKEGNVFMYPISLVGKRFHAGEKGFFATLYPILCKQAGELSVVPKSKPFWKFW